MYLFDLGESVLSSTRRSQNLQDGGNRTISFQTFWVRSNLDNNRSDF